MLGVVLIVLHLAHFHGPDNQLVEINPDSVVAIREPRDNEQHFHELINCLIFTNDGKFTGVTEQCEQVERLLIDAAPSKSPPPIEKK